MPTYVRLRHSDAVEAVSSVCDVWSVSMHAYPKLLEPLNTSNSNKFIQTTI